MKQLQAAYCIEAIEAVFQKSAEYRIFRQLAKYLSHFDIDFSSKNAPFQLPANLQSLFLSLGAYISRGNPTLASLYIENEFASIYFKTALTEKADGSISYSLTTDSETIASFANQILKAMHIIDPRVANETEFKKVKQTWENIPGGFEHDFLFSILPHYVGKYAMQLFDFERSFDTVSNANPEAALNPIDFSIEIPYHPNCKKGLIVEIDGSVHYQVTQRKIDVVRNDLANLAQWADTLHIDTNYFENIETLLLPLKNFLQTNFITTISENFENPVYNTEQGLDALQFALTPVAVARIQRTIIEAVLNGTLDTKATLWQIAIVERDVPAAYLAIADLQQQILHFAQLQINSFTLPQIELDVYNTDEFMFSKLNSQYFNQIKSLKEFQKTKEYDLLIDCSVLMRSRITKTPVNNAKCRVSIRSAVSVFSVQELQIQFDNKFARLTGKTDKPVEKKLLATEYVLQNALRKKKISLPQLKLLDKLLQKESILATTPYGSGKTFVMLFAAVLHQAKTLIVVPAKLLLHQLQNQFNNLKISSVSTATQLWQNTTAKVILANPDDLRNNEIIEQLSKLKFDVGFVYIDEAQTISEWSYDFRPEMSGLYRPIEKFTDAAKIVVSAFTSLNSYEIVEDVLGELKIPSSNVLRQNFETFDKQKISVLQYQKKETEKFVAINVAETLLKSSKYTLLHNLLPKKEELTKKSIVFADEQNIANRAKTGLADKIASHYNAEQSTHFQADNMLNYSNFNQFNQGKANILTANPDLISGVEIGSPQQQVWFDAPLAVNELVRTAGRAKQTSDEQETVVLLNNSRFLVGEETANEKPKNAEHYFGLKRLKKRLPAKSKEEVLISDIFRSISFAPQKTIEILEQIVSDEFGLSISFSTLPVIYPYQLLIYVSGIEIGKIDFHSKEVSTTEESVNQLFTNQIIDFVQNFIQKNTPPQTSIFDGLLAETANNQKAGLTDFLINMTEESIKVIQIPFQNDALWRITQLLNQIAPEKFTVRKVAECYYAGISLVEFKDKLSAIHLLDSNPENTKYLTKIEALFPTIRTKAETRLLIHRLSECGIFNDYWIDNLRTNFSVELKKQSSQNLQKNFRRNISNNLSPNKIDEYVNGIKTEKGTTEEEQTVRTLVRFIYSDIIENHLTELNVVRRLLSKADMEKYEVTSEIEQFLKYWYFARYANSVVQPNLPTATENLTKLNFDIVIEFITHAGYKRDNWKHLKASCRHFLKRMPENYVLQLLSAFTVILLEYKNADSVCAAIDSAVMCFDSMRKSEKLTANEFISRFNQFFEKIFQQATDMRLYVEPLAVAKLHNYWLSTFTAKFLQGYGN